MLSLKKNNFGVLHIRLSSNNIILTVTDTVGSVLTWCSSARVGFLGPKRATYMAALANCEFITKNLLQKNITTLVLRFTGLTTMRKPIIKTLSKSVFKIIGIFDNTPIPHNGCRLRKKKRK